jgi:phosphatidate phosphatase LPIN
VKQDNPDEDGAESNITEVPAEIETKEFQIGSTTYRLALSLCGEDEFGKDLVRTPGRLY